MTAVFKLQGVPHIDGPSGLHEITLLIRLQLAKK